MAQRDFDPRMPAIAVAQDVCPGDPEFPQQAGDIIGVLREAQFRWPIAGAAMGLQLHGDHLAAFREFGKDAAEGGI